MRSQSDPRIGRLEVLEFDHHPPTLQSSLLNSLSDRVTESSGSLKTEWLTTAEAAAYLKISEATLRNMTSNGQVPYYKLGRRNRYRFAELKELLLAEKRGGNHGY